MNVPQSQNDRFVFARRSTLAAAAVLTALAATAVIAAQTPGQGAAPAQPAGGGGARSARSSPPLPELPLTFETTLYKIRVSLVAKGLAHPFSLAPLPNGDMLITERDGRLRIVRNGVLDPAPIAGVPMVRAAVLGGLLDVVLHPKFAENKLIYLAYSKPGENRMVTTAVARGKFDGKALTEVKDIFVANNWSTSTQNFGGRIAFDRDGFMFLTVGDRYEQERAQKTDDHGGKVLRLRDDGTVPPDNPFVGKAGYAPEIYSLGHRSEQGLAVNPVTNAVFETEHGPQGGDELNIILPGRNYGWPIVTFGINYNGEKVSDITTRADLEPPFVYWVPSIAPSGLSFYTGDKFPGWKTSVFVGGMFQGRTRATGQVQRVVLNEKGQPIQREPLLVDLHQRIRDIRQGPDGLLYVLTEEDAGALLKIEPVK
jgi:glucose/arabinose dehydrogenase